MQSSLYVSMKSIISLLEAVDYHTLETIQCRILLTFYEMGHGMFHIASISIAACSRQARLIGLHKTVIDSSGDGMAEGLLEEKRRAWWVCLNMDRFVTLCSGDGVLGTPNSKSEDLLPMDDGLWLRNIVPMPTPTELTLATSYSVRVGQFARECQVSNLIALVIRHVFDPSPDSRFQAEEALQLERTLSALYPVLMDEQIKFGKYCAALGMCTNALFMLLNDAEKRDGKDVLSAMEPLSTQIVVFSSRLFGDGEGIDYGTLSPYIPLSLYQAAVVQSRLYRRTGERCYGEALLTLKRLLGYFNKRWLVAGFCLDALEAENPVLLPS
ncbi:hypothetical protein LTR56_020586 [Elasticomyces elasticus]|nr:hypothetical protein LTR22_025448 [Elasticomyces elasticus]KAK3625129.1 hypothetical protein LTR56_020586 [Elasticomyces elasticus]KAK5740589.1 hypothetical protein LTS12_024907 [Elasticomyces elasticus]